MADLGEVERAKQAVASLPMTYAALTGASGRSVKILVRLTRPDGTLPTDESDWQRLYEQGYDYAVRLYDAVLPSSVTRETASIYASFRMTLDPQPYYNPKAVPLTIEPSHTAPDTPNPASGDAYNVIRMQGAKFSARNKQIDYQKYADNEFLYRRACELAAEEWHQRFGDGYPNDDEAFVAEVARQLCLLGMDEEEAMAHMYSHLWSRQEEAHVRAIVASAYTEAAAQKPKSDEAVRVRRETTGLIAFLQARYVFRFNTVMGYTEFRPNNTYTTPYRPVDSRVQRRLALDARMNGLNVWDNDVARFLGSDYIDNYDPVWDYLDSCRNKWDGRDRIRELARTVPTANQLWPDWFYTWFLAMVRQWMSTEFDLYGNQVAPLLISEQGYNKSTFCRSLLPPELSWGYNDNLLLAEKHHVLQQMNQMLLINLDEFNQVSPALQQGFVKNIISLPSVKMKRPYGKHVEAFQRRASFIAATNMADVLADPTGSRRFLAVELTGPIDVSRRPNHVQLYAQALAALDAHEPSWFDDNQTRQIIEHNRGFQQLPPAEQFFRDLFEPAAEGDEGAEWLTATAIFSRIREEAGNVLSEKSLVGIGRMLSNMSNLVRKRAKEGSIYLVKPRK